MIILNINSQEMKGIHNWNTVLYSHNELENKLPSIEVKPTTLT